MECIKQKLSNNSRRLKFKEINYIAHTQNLRSAPLRSPDSERGNCLQAQAPVTWIIEPQQTTYAVRNQNQNKKMWKIIHF